MDSFDLLAAFRKNRSRIANLCDCFCHAECEEANGDLEGFGMVFLEANATGKPVIGGRSGGTADAITGGNRFRIDAANK